MKRENITVLEQSHLKLSKLAASQYYYQEVIIEGIKHSLFSEYQFKIRAKSQKYRRYTGNFPQMPVYTGASVFIRATWAHCFRSEIMLFSTNVCVYGRARIYKGYWFM